MFNVQKTLSFYPRNVSHYKDPWFISFCPLKIFNHLELDFLSLSLSLSLSYFLKPFKTIHLILTFKHLTTSSQTHSFIQAPTFFFTLQWQTKAMLAFPSCLMMKTCNKILKTSITEDLSLEGEALT